MPPRLTNLFVPPAPAPGMPAHRPETETFHPLIQNPAFRLEHIVSHGQPSPPDFWYDQPEDEWVLLLRGTATLNLAGEGPVAMNGGDSLVIGAHRKHRVEQVSEDAVWVALHFKAGAT
jgi:cupin 2 domain-containing protein